MFPVFGGTLGGVPLKPKSRFGVDWLDNILGSLQTLPSAESMQFAFAKKQNELADMEIKYNKKALDFYDAILKLSPPKPQPTTPRPGQMGLAAGIGLLAELLRPGAGTQGLSNFFGGFEQARNRQSEMEQMEFQNQIRQMQGMAQLEQQRGQIAGMEAERAGAESKRIGDVITRGEAQDRQKRLDAESQLMRVRDDYRQKPSRGLAEKWRSLDPISAPTPEEVERDIEIAGSLERDRIYDNWEKTIGRYAKDYGFVDDKDLPALEATKKSLEGKTGITLPPIPNAKSIALQKLQTDKTWKFGVLLPKYQAELVDKAARLEIARARLNRSGGSASSARAAGSDAARAMYSDKELAKARAWVEQTKATLTKSPTPGARGQYEGALARYETMLKMNGLATEEIERARDMATAATAAMGGMFQFPPLMPPPSASSKPSNPKPASKPSPSTKAAPKSGKTRSGATFTISPT